MYERCDLCGEGTLEPREAEVDIGGERVTLEYHECSWCGAQLVSRRELERNRSSIKGRCGS